MTPHSMLSPTTYEYYTGEHVYPHGAHMRLDTLLVNAYGFRRTWFLTNPQAQLQLNLPPSHQTLLPLHNAFLIPLSPVHSGFWVLNPDQWS